MGGTDIGDTKEKKSLEQTDYDLGNSPEWSWNKKKVRGSEWSDEVTTAELRRQKERKKKEQVLDFHESVAFSQNRYLWEEKVPTALWASSLQVLQSHTDKWG